MADDLDHILETLSHGDVPMGLLMLGNQPVDKRHYEGQIKTLLVEAEKRLTGEAREFVLSLLSRLLVWGEVAQPGTPLLDAEEDLFAQFDRWSQLENLPSNWVVGRAIVAIARKHDLDPKVLNKHANALLQECI
jgi:hypothetical protein